MRVVLVGPVDRVTLDFLPVQGPPYFRLLLLLPQLHQLRLSLGEVLRPAMACLVGDRIELEVPLPVALVTPVDPTLPVVPLPLGPPYYRLLRLILPVRLLHLSLAKELLQAMVFLVVDHTGLEELLPVVLGVLVDQEHPGVQQVQAPLDSLQPLMVPWPHLVRPAVEMQLQEHMN